MLVCVCTVFEGMVWRITFMAEVYVKGPLQTSMF